MQAKRDSLSIAVGLAAAAIAGIIAGGTADGLTTTDMLLRGLGVGVVFGAVAAALSFCIRRAGSK